MEKEQIQKFIDNLFSLYENNKINKKQLKEEIINYCARISVAPNVPVSAANLKNTPVNQTQVSVQNQQQSVTNTTVVNKKYNQYDSSAPLVSIQKLTKLYKGRSAPAVNNISFNIYPGQFHAFIGANGAGKTTTIKSIFGAYSSKKYQGKITINGKPNENVDAKAMIGYIPEEAKFPKKMTTKVYLTKTAMLSGFNSSQAKNIASSIITKLGLSGLESKFPDSFSSGQKKKILLAQALLHDPKVLIMDEPAANLDPIARKELFNTLVNLQNEGKAFFFHYIFLMKWVNM